MSVYNGARYVREAIDSILNQTFRDFEFIVIDDCSSDETSLILKSYCDERIRIITNENNLGLAKSLNRGLQISKGEYVARQDADDISEPQRFEKQVAFLDQHLETAVLGCTTLWIDDKSQPFLEWRQPTDNPNIQSTLLDYCCLIHGSVMYRTRVVQEVGGYDPVMRTGQDYDLWLRISETHDLACLPEELYRYRRHNDMASMKCKQEQNDYAKTALKKAIERRLSYANLALRFKYADLPPQLRLMNKKQVAQRYVWWSLGARCISKKLTLRLLLTALFLHPTTPEIWTFINSAFSNKVALIKNRLKVEA